MIHFLPQVITFVYFAYRLLYILFTRNLARKKISDKELIKPVNIFITVLNQMATIVVLFAGIFWLHIGFWILLAAFLLFIRMALYWIAILSAINLPELMPVTEDKVIHVSQRMIVLGLEVTILFATGFYCNLIHTL